VGIQDFAPELSPASQIGAKQSSPTLGGLSGIAIFQAELNAIPNEPGEPFPGLWDHYWHKRLHGLFSS
jgi:hypothetical protein